ncbi:hypothetical protein ACFCYN_18720 [Gottfriedia sp. NPDC056225]|uniref:hypothetical protein n=1 Tax=Gottfriedia sp. NPDC056225 TaxID=3345751 RepID=UPI0035D5ED82
MNIPYLLTGLERLVNEGHPIKANASSYMMLVAMALLFSFGYFVFATFLWKKRVKTKSGEVLKQKSEQNYKAFRKNRVTFLDKKQQNYREKLSTGVFIWYRDFKERILLNSNELNYHMLAAG